MLLEKDLKKLFNELYQGHTAHLNIDGSEITVRVFENASKLFLTSPVYNGGNFIPTSVRRCVSQRSPFQDAQIKTNLVIDEGNFKIDLNYLGQLENLTNQSFKDIVEEFSWLVGEWRLFLDEHDKNDLVHVRVK